MEEKKYYYVSIMDGPGRYILAAGPFLTFNEASMTVRSVNDKACELDPKAWFYAYGTCSITRMLDDTRPLPTGVLNKFLELS